MSRSTQRASVHDDPLDNRVPVGTLGEASDGSLVRTVPVGSHWYRIHLTANDPRWFGSSLGELAANRFDDPNPGASHPSAPPAHPNALPDTGQYGVCYIGMWPEASFVETFFRRLPGTAVALDELRIRSLSVLRITRPVTVVCLDGAGLLQRGLSATVATGSPADYPLSRVVARSLWRHPDIFAGLEYRARHDTHQFSVALFDRAADAIDVVSSSAILSDMSMLKRWVLRYHFPLV